MFLRDERSTIGKFISDVLMKGWDDTKLVIAAKSDLVDTFNAVN
jgi:hypothetical protein